MDVAFFKSESIDWVERGLVPDAVIRAGIRHLLRVRLDEIRSCDPAAGADRSHVFASGLAGTSVALEPAKVNRQHYEIPAEFFEQTLGAHRKYSCCLWDDDVATLDEAEARSLDRTCRHAGLADGQRILELGCGWGSLTLWLSRNYPNSRITAVSNSHSQRHFIEQQATERRLANVRVVTCDMNDFEPAERFDRIVSVEMFEHMRNWPELFRRVRSWLNPGGRFLMHVFVHRSTPYAFEGQDASDWMSHHFFSGGMMPSDDLPLHFQDDLRFLRRWRWSGTHYERTANAWLQRLDAHRGHVMPILQSVYGPSEAPLWWMRWRIFFMACAELFGFRSGTEWWVGHYLFEARA
jgi:cyclopropane-fatty-acyl-phospholipid synthase